MALGPPNVMLDNCPAYVREWITRENARSNEHKNIDEDKN